VIRGLALDGPRVARDKRTSSVRFAASAETSLASNAATRIAVKYAMTRGKRATGRAILVGAGRETL
jgi:hypothetical protein